MRKIKMFVALSPSMKISTFALLLVAGNLASAQTYSYFTFDPPGATSTTVNGMNNAGQMVGSYQDTKGTHNFLRGADGEFTSIEAAGASLGTTTIDAINNLGQIAGNYVEASTGLRRSYIRSADGRNYTAFDIPNLGPGFGPKGINDNGDVAGARVEISASVADGFVRKADGTYTPIVITGGGIRVRAINNRGDIVGWYLASGSAEGLVHGFRRDPSGVITTMDLPGTDSGTEFSGINNLGRRTGTWGASGNGFSETADGIFSSVSVLGAQVTFPAAIDDTGRVAGYYSDGSTYHGFLAVLSASTTPVIRAVPPGVISALGFGGASSIAPGSWIEIYGQNLASTTREWRASDFTGNAAPTSLDGVRVTINGIFAYVSYISPGQVNALVPSSVGSGAGRVMVTNGTQITAPYMVNVSVSQPGLLVLPRTDNQDTRYLGAVFPDFVTYVLPPGYTTAVPTRRAQPGDTIVLFGVGLGPVVPSVPVGQIAEAGNALPTLPQVFFNQTPGTVTYAGLVAGVVGLYQINVVVPDIVMPAGQTFNDAVAVSVQLGGLSIPAAGLPSSQSPSLLVPVQQR